MIKQAHPAHVVISFMPGGAEQHQTRTMNDKSHPLIMDQRHNRIPQKVSAKETRRGVSATARTRGLTRRVRVSYPLVTAKSVPTRGSHPNARSAVRVGRWRQRAANGRMSNACASDVTRDCLLVVQQPRHAPLPISIHASNKNERRTTRRGRAIQVHPNPSFRGGTARIRARRGGVWPRIRPWR